MNGSQLKTLLWLRWRLTLNQLRKGHPINFAIGIVALTVGYVMVLVTAIGGFFAGWKLLGDANPDSMLVFWDVATGIFLFVWCLGVLHEIQRSELLDLQRLLHMPVALRQLFVLNYLSSLLTPSVLIALPGLLSASLGLAVHSGVAQLLLVPLVAGFFFMVTAWTYCARGWLIGLMVNPRRRRSVVAGMTLLVVLLGQAPNLYFNVFRNPGERRAPVRGEGLSQYARSETTAWMHAALPPLWMAGGAGALRKGNPATTLLATAACWALGALGMRLAYRATIRFYQGAEKPRKVATAASPGPSPGPRKPSMVSWEIPWIQPDVSALGLASLRSMLRAPEMKMALIGPIVMLLVFGSLFMARSRMEIPEAARGFMVAGLISFIGFGYLQLLLNQFGLDRHGFRSLVLLPTPRRLLLMGKNLAYSPLFFIPGTIALMAAPWMIHASPVYTLAGFFQLAALYLVLCVVGNTFSIGAPIRINAGSMKPTKNPPKTLFLNMIVHLLFPLLCLPVVIPAGLGFLAQTGGFAPAPLICLAVSLLSAGACLAIYLLTLDPLGRWFQSREKEMLRHLTEEVE